MIRVFATLACGALVAGCSSVPSFDTTILKGASGGGGISVRAESNPSGAEARSQTGATCRTPCALELPANGLSSITFTLQGYHPQTVSVNVATTRESGDLPDTGIAEQVRIDPNPVFAQLELVPPAPPPPAKRRAAPPKPRPQAQPQQQPAPAPIQQGFGPPPGQFR